MSAVAGALVGAGSRLLRQALPMQLLLPGAGVAKVAL